MGLERGVAAAVDVVLGVRDGLKSVGVVERVSMGDGDGVTGTNFGGGGTFVNASKFCSSKGNSLGFHGRISLLSEASSTSLGVGLTSTRFCLPLPFVLATVEARGWGLDARAAAVLASGVDARLWGLVRFLLPPDMKLRNFCFSIASHLSCLRL